MAIPLSELHPFKDHPFKVKDDEAMMDTTESIRQYGVLVPAIARPDPDGGYELVAGHRRHHASGRAFAYKIKLDAMKHQSERSDLTCAQVWHKSDRMKSRDILAEQVRQSKTQVQKCIRLTELIPELLDMVDEKKIAFNPAYELSFLKPEEQGQLIVVMDEEQATPSLSQAQRLKKFSTECKLGYNAMSAIMSDEKKGDLDKVTLGADTLQKYFPKRYTPQKMQNTTKVKNIKSICWQCFSMRLPPSAITTRRWKNTICTVAHSKPPFCCPDTGERTTP